MFVFLSAVAVRPFRCGPERIRFYQGYDSTNSRTFAIEDRTADTTLDTFRTRDLRRRQNSQRNIHEIHDSNSIFPKQHLKIHFFYNIL